MAHESCKKRIVLDIDNQFSHILLIDDNPEAQRPLLGAPRSGGYRLSMAFDGLQGYSRAISAAPDLILSEARLPRLDGLALCRRLKANPQTVAIPFIFLSAADAVSDRLAGLYSGAVDYIVKPYAPAEVAARVRIHLRLAAAASLDAPERGKGDPLVSEDQVLVRAAQHELSTQLAARPKLGAVARRLGVNERRLLRAFHRHLGMTPTDYLREQRMRAARRLLDETTLSITAIAAEVGFSSAANFTTAFRGHMGHTPSDYRRLNKQKKTTRSAFPA